MTDVFADIWAAVTTPPVLIALAGLLAACGAVLLIDAVIGRRSNRTRRTTDDER